MKKQMAWKMSLPALIVGCMMVAMPAEAQYGARYSGYSQPQFDVGFGVSTLVAPDAASADLRHNPQTMGGGAYMSFSASYLFAKDVGVEGEAAWRASQNLYEGYQPFRPIFYNFNLIYAPRLGKDAQLELLGGVGGVSTRFYSQIYVCDVFTYSCRNYVSLNHFTGDLGIGLRVYVGRGLFVRPEYRQYFIHDNREFSSDRAGRAGVTLGYSFGR